MKEKDFKSLSVDVQRRIDACNNVVNWASEDKEHRGCIVLATDEEASTCAVVGCGYSLIPALASAIKSTPNLRDILATVMMLDMMIGGSKNDTEKDK